MSMVRGIVNIFITQKKGPKKKKHITSSVNKDGDKITNPKDILEEEEGYFEEVYTSRNMDPNCPTFKEFFEIENALSEEIAKTCEGVMSIDECEIALKNYGKQENSRHRWVNA